MVAVPSNVIDALRESHQLGIFLRLATSPVTRVWLGVNDIPSGIVSVDPTSFETYYGGGRLNDIPNLEAVINGVADRAEFRLSGIDPDTAAEIDIGALDVRGKAFHVGITTLDDNFQPMSQIIPLITGRASFVTETSPPVTGQQNRVVTLGISVGFGVTTRTRQSQVLWSPPHHKAFYPTDLFCDGTARLERGASPVWPRF